MAHLRHPIGECTHPGPVDRRIGGGAEAEPETSASMEVVWTSA